MRYILILALLFVLAACTSDESVIPYEDIPTTGDAARGEELFNTQVDLAPACSSCHNPDNQATPPLDDFASVAASRAAGMSAREYTFYAIAQPSLHIVEGYGNAMYNQYDETFSAQNIADLIAYLLGE